MLQAKTQLNLKANLLVKSMQNFTYFGSPENKKKAGGRLIFANLYFYTYIYKKKLFVYLKFNLNYPIGSQCCLKMTFIKEI